MLTIKNVPKDWETGTYQEYRSLGSKLYDYAEKDNVRLAVFQDFRGAKKFGVYIFVSNGNGDWKPVCTDISTLNEAVHVMVTIIVMGAVNAYPR